MPMRTRPGRLLSAAVLLAVGVQMLGGAAADAAESSITWSVRPATESGADGRSWIEVALEPGESVVEFAEVSNFSDEEVTFTLASADGYITTTGRFNMLPLDQPSVDAGTWIATEDSLTLGPKDSAVIPLHIDVPSDATPGDHAAGFAASVLSSGTTDSGAEVGVESRVGFRVMVRVTGELEARLSPLAVSAHYDLSWNPFMPGRIVTDTTVSNAGNTRLDMSLEASAGQQRAGAEEGSELFPGGEQSVRAVIDSVWPLGIVVLDVTATGTPLDTLEGAQADPVTQTVQVSVWAVPWPQILVLFGVVLIVVMVIGARRRGRRHLQREIERAREEARREMGMPSS